GIRNGSPRPIPHRRTNAASHCASRGWSRRASVDPPTIMYERRGGFPSRSSKTMPSTLTILACRQSTNCLSRTSRITTPISASKDLQRNRHQRHHTRQANNKNYDAVAEPPIPVLANVALVIHQEEKRHDGEW